MPNSENQHLKIKESTKTTFLLPVIFCLLFFTSVTESEVEKVAKVLKNIIIGWNL